MIMKLFFKKYCFFFYFWQKIRQLYSEGLYSWQHLKTEYTLIGHVPRTDEKFSAFAVGAP